jgi:hypothetical protein
MGAFLVVLLLFSLTEKGQEANLHQGKSVKNDYNFLNISALQLDNTGLTGYSNAENEVCRAAIARNMIVKRTSKILGQSEFHSGMDEQNVIYDQLGRIIHSKIHLLSIRSMN